MHLIAQRKKGMQMMLLALSLIMIAGCSSQINHSLTWPSNLNVIQLSDGGACLDAQSAIRLAELRADIEAM
jgi:hypothetical protein